MGETRPALWFAVGVLAVAAWCLYRGLAGSGRVVVFLRAVQIAGFGVLGAALLGWMSLSLFSSGSGSAGRPNVLLISIDSLRQDRVHAYGNPNDTTPTLDALAEDGVLFTQAVSPTSWTLPAHLTMLTGLHPLSHLVVVDTMSLDHSAVTLAEAFLDAGYNTAGIVSGPYLRGEYGFSQGFEHYDDYTVAATDNFESHRQITSPTLLRLAQRWLADWTESGKQKPFFMFLHMWDVHYDYIPPSPYDKMFDSDYSGTITGEAFYSSPLLHAGMDPRDVEHLLALYDGELRYTDDHIGMILEELKRLGAFENTIIAVTSDHGDEFFEHGDRGHRKTLYDEVLLVPLIIRFPPKLPRGKVVTRQARLQDLPLTLASLAGLDAPESFGANIRASRLRNYNLAELLEDPAETAVPAFADVEGGMVAARTERAKIFVDLENDGTE
ncbi:MAG: sulfatase, partial [bacterium]|nr:sulfatase [bacterium]